MISKRTKAFSKYQPHYEKNENKSINKKSSSHEKNNSRFDYDSAVFESGRNSLCVGTPRVQQKSEFVEKYKTYIKFISNNKVMPQFVAKKNTYLINKKGAVTPNPKRLSPGMIQKGRKSACDKMHDPIKNNSRQGKDVMGISPRIASQKENDLNFLVMGKIMKKEGEKKLKIEKIMKKGQSKIKKGERSLIEDKQTIDKQQQKLKQKLFRGIQFYRDLGKGAHALVRSAVDWNKNRKIAVKVYEKLKLGEEQMKSIQRQIEILLFLEHVNIVKLYQIIQTYKTVNLMMEYGGGNSLEQYIRSRQKGKLTEGEAKHIFAQVLRAVGYMHQNNITHRDLKTQNILLNKHLQLKIIDFGFSLRCLSDKTISSYCGTPTYMAPEVVTKTPHNPQNADKWSLGILLYVMLNGQCPFKANSQKELFTKITEGHFTYLVQITKEAKALIQSFLKKNPKDRCSAKQALISPWFSD